MFHHRATDGYSMCRGRALYGEDGEMKAKAAVYVILAAAFAGSGAIHRGPIGAMLAAAGALSGWWVMRTDTDQTATVFLGALVGASVGTVLGSSAGWIGGIIGLVVGVVLGAMVVVLLRERP